MSCFNVQSRDAERLMNSRHALADECFERQREWGLAGGEDVDPINRSTASDTATANAVVEGPAPPNATLQIPLPSGAWQFCLSVSVSVCVCVCHSVL